jgi:hypothetical protein
VGAIYDPVRQRFVMFGATCTASCMYYSVWALPLTGPALWTAGAAGLGPRARAGAVSVYDPVRDRMLVFGGYGVKPCGVDLCRVDLNDVWALNFGGMGSGRNGDRGAGISRAPRLRCTDSTDASIRSHPRPKESVMKTSRHHRKLAGAIWILIFAALATCALERPPISKADCSTGYATGHTTGCWDSLASDQEWPDIMIHSVLVRGQNDTSHVVWWGEDPSTIDFTNH